MLNADSANQKTLGRYVVGAELGRGGMGIVCRAHDLNLKRDVALKMLAPHLARDPKFVKRFLREAHAAARLSHPNIVKVLAAGEDRGIQYIAMEYVEGKALSRIIQEEGPLEVGRAVDIAGQVLDAVAEAHANGIVHRDVKPQNIMVCPDGLVKVMDFGLAKVMQDMSGLTMEGTRLGTPLYMAPEQCRGKPVDARTDVYSAGVTLFEMLAGAPPYESASTLAVMYQVTSQAFPPLSRFRPDVPAAIEQTILRMTAKRPDRRLPSAEAAATRLRRAWAGARGEAVSPEPEESLDTRPEMRRFRDWRIVSAVGLAVLLVVASAVWFSRLGRSPDSNDATGSAPRAAQSEKAPARAAPTQQIIGDSVAQFSGIQGESGWRYGYYEQIGDSASFREMPSFQERKWKYGPAEENFNIWETGCHPGVTRPVVRRWISPVSGSVSIYGELARDKIGRNGEGVTGRVLVDGKEVWSRHIAVGDGKGLYYAADASVSVGSIVDLVVEPGANDLYDSSKFTAKIAADVPSPQESWELVADSARDFSSEQGKNNWYYGGYDVAMDFRSFQPSVTFLDVFGPKDTRLSAGGAWVGPDLHDAQYYLDHSHESYEIWHYGGKPRNGFEAVRRWKSPVAGTLCIIGEFFKADYNPQGNGVTARVLVDGREVWSRFLEAQNSEQVAFNIDAPVNVESVVDFCLSPNGHSSADASRFVAKIFHNAHGASN